MRDSYKNTVTHPQTLCFQMNMTWLCADATGDDDQGMYVLVQGPNLTSFLQVQFSRLQRKRGERTNKGWSPDMSSSSQKCQHRWGLREARETNTMISYRFAFGIHQRDHSFHPQVQLSRKNAPSSSQAHRKQDILGKISFL